MSENEIIGLQRAHPGRSYLLLVGMFYHAYEGGAFALARLTGYRVVMRHRKGGDMATVGFPATRLDDVCRRLASLGVELHDEAEGNRALLWFDGGDTSPMAVEPAEPRNANSNDGKRERGNEEDHRSDLSQLLAELRGYSLADSTPMAAMNFLHELKRKYGA